MSDADRSPSPDGAGRTRRVPAMEVRRRFSVIDDLYREHGGDRAKVFEAVRLSDEKLSTRTVRRYLRRVELRVMSEAAEEREEKYAKHRARLRRLALAAERKGDLPTALLALRDLARLDGLHLERHEVVHRAGAPAGAEDYDRLTTDEKLLLRALRAKARTNGHAAPTDEGGAGPTNGAGSAN